MTAAVPVATRDPIRVMVVDDSLVVRSLVTGWLADCPDLALVAALRTGREAVDQFERADPDVVILDVEMPELDGLAALPLLLAKKRNLTVIMASTLTRRNAEVSLKALALGAADYVSKPESRSGVSLAAFRQGLIEKTRQIGRSRRVRHTPAVTPPRPARLAPHTAEPSFAAIFESPSADLPVALRRANAAPPRALLIGASTGGPQALMRLLPQLRAVAGRLPVLIVQHMPPTFTAILAEHLSRACGWPIREAEDGEPVLAGQMYLARGDRHMRVARRNGSPVIELDDGAPINFCKPSVDPLFASAGEVWGAAALGIVLTGMGHDGTAGARAMVNAGGTVIAQDEATSVVWGMPGAVAHAGLCSAVLPLDAIAPKIICQCVGEFA